MMGAGFLCNCAPGWNGTNCEIAEGALCFPGGEQYKASLFPFSPAVTQCNPNPCGAHGSCIAVNAPSGPLAFCSCENRWSGRFCDYNLDGEHAAFSSLCETIVACSKAHVCPVTANRAVLARR